MIRASNFPVLLVIALYERQQYRDTTLAEQLGDFAERYVGSLPRRLKAAGKLAEVFRRLKLTISWFRELSP